MSDWEARVRRLLRRISGPEGYDEATPLSVKRETAQLEAEAEEGAMAEGAIDADLDWALDRVIDRRSAREGEAERVVAVLRAAVAYADAVRAPALRGDDGYAADVERFAATRAGFLDAVDAWRAGWGR